MTAICPTEVGLQRTVSRWPSVTFCYNFDVSNLMLFMAGAAPPRPESSIDHPNLNFSFALHHISEIDPAPLLDSQSPDDAVLAILCRSGDTRQTIRRILARIAELDPVSRSDAATRLAILAQLRRAVPVEIEEAKSMTVSFNIRTHPVFAEIFEEVKLQGVLEGEARGETRGRAGTLLRQLHRRYGTVPQAIVDRFFAASSDELDSWTDAVLDAPSLEAIFDPSKH